MALKINNLFGGSPKPVPKKHGGSTQTNTNKHMEDKKLKNSNSAEYDKNLFHSTETSFGGYPTVSNIPVENTTQQISKKETFSNSIKSTKDWVRTPQKLPEMERPILFNTPYNKLVTGYRIKDGYVTDNAYYLNKYKKEHGFLEWKYIDSCTSLSKCPDGFPRCDICKFCK